MKKEVKSGKYILYYERYIDDMGFEQDSFDLFDEEKRIHRPFMAPIKVTNNTKDTPINKIGYEWSNKELKNILQEALQDNK